MTDFKTERDTYYKNHHDEFGCTTGDCPHEKQSECNASIFASGYSAALSSSLVKQMAEVACGLDYKSLMLEGGTGDSSYSRC